MAVLVKKPHVQMIFSGGSIKGTASKNVSFALAVLLRKLQVKIYRLLCMITYHSLLDAIYISHK